MHSATLTPDQRADRLASRQYGLLTNEQAQTCGLSQDQIESRVTAGRWIRLAVGVYLVAGAPPSWRRDAMAACLSGPAGTVASHLTAAALLGAWTPPPLPYVLGPRARSGRTRLGQFHTGTLTGPDRCVVDRIPCTSPARTLVDAAGIVDRPALEHLTDALLCDRRTTPESVFAALDRAGRRGRTGAGLLASVLEVWVAGIEPGSPAEIRFLRRLLEWGVDDAVTQYEIRDTDGTFLARVDIASPGRRLIFEYDSDRWHNPRHWTKDERRYARILALGWHVEPVSKRDLLPSARRIAAIIAAHPVRQGGRAHPYLSRSTV